MMYGMDVFNGYTKTIDNREMTVLVIINGDEYDVHLMEGKYWGSDPTETFKESIPITEDFKLDEHFANYILDLYMIGKTTQKVDFFTQGFMNYKFTHKNKVSYEILHEAKAVNLCLRMSGNRIIVMDTIAFETLEDMYSNDAVDLWKKIDAEMVVYLLGDKDFVKDNRHALRKIIGLIVDNTDNRSSGEMLDDVYEIAKEVTCLEAIPTDSEITNRMLFIHGNSNIVNFMGRLAGIVMLDGDTLDEDDSIEMILESTKLYLNYKKTAV